MTMGVAYDFAQVADYAHAVRPSLDLLVYYPAGSPTDYSVDARSEFVTEMHALEMSVQTSEGQLEGLNDVETTKMIALKGVDGVYTDYPLAKLRAYELIGSQSTLFQEPLPQVQASAVQLVAGLSFVFTLFLF